MQKKGMIFNQSPVDDLKNKIFIAKKNILKKSKMLTGIDPYVLREDEERVYLSFIINLCYELMKKEKEGGVDEKFKRSH